MRPFEVSWSEAEVERVLERVRATRLPPTLADPDWTLGCDPAFLERFGAFWAGDYDWRAAVASLNRFPQFIETIGDQDIHFVHVRGESEGRRPLILTHGWPGSHYEFWEVIEPLAFPSRFGGDAADAFDVVVPSLPGYGFSGKPKSIMGPRAVAKLWNTLMTERLGYTSYWAQGGDWGGYVTAWLGHDHGASVKAIHVNSGAFDPGDAPQSEAETAWAQTLGASVQVLTAYVNLQMTKPQSIALAAADNPLGQAAWILERFHDWADRREGDLEAVFGLDHLVTNIMLYVMTESFGSAALLYRGLALENSHPLVFRCETPTGMAAFPDPAYAPAPRSRMERAYNLVHWSEPARGGHFAAMEAPKAFVEDVRLWGRTIDRL